jgi:hypothetical protein
MKKLWKLAPWLTRIMLIPPTAIFTLIASRYLFHPVESGAEIGLAFNAPLAVTIIRVGFGAFPLGCALFTLSCLLSKQRVLIGLGFVSTMIGTALVVRVFGMLADGTVAQNMKLVRAEIGLLAVMAVGILLELGRRRAAAMSVTDQEATEPI